jgi:hypothetical protein
MATLPAQYTIDAGDDPELISVSYAMPASP